MNNKTRISCLLFFAVLFIYMATIAFLTPKMSDDYMFTLHFTGVRDLIHNVFLKTYDMYFNRSGRVIIYSFEYFIFSLPIVIVNILNALVFCLLIYGIFLNAALRPVREIKDVFSLFIILAIVWYFIFEFAEVTFWKTGAVAYLWPLTGTLYFIYPFVQLLYNKNVVSQSMVRVCLVLLGAIILSTGHETLFPPVCFLLILSNALYYYRNKKIPRWSVFASLIYVGCSLVLIGAPGNYVRNRQLLEGSKESLISFHKFLNLSKEIIGHFTIPIGSAPLFILVLVCLALLVWEKPRKLSMYIITMSLILLSTALIVIDNKITHIINIICLFFSLAIFIVYWLKKNEEAKLNFFIFTGLGLLAAYDMIVIAINVFGNRTAFFTDIFFIIAIVSVLSRQFTIKKWPIIYGAIGTIAMLITVPSMVQAYSNAKLLKSRDEAREELITIYKKNQIKTPTLSPLFQLEPAIGDLDIFVYLPHLVVRDIISTRWFYYGFDHMHVNNYVVSWRDVEEYTKKPQNAGEFNLFVKRNILFFWVSANSCDALPNKSPFYLRIYPYWQNRWVNRVKNNYEEFSWQNHQVAVITDQGQIKQGICMLAIELPNSRIKKLEAGQYHIENGRRELAWQTSVPVG